MQFPIKVHYALLATLAMAEVHDADKLLTARTISDQQGVPSQFLGQILQQLRSSGVVTSVRGANGGFKLSSHPSELTVAEVVDAVCPSSIAASPTNCDSPLAATVDALWEELASLQRQTLRNLTLSEMLHRSTARGAEMFYI